ncbi:non-ribosomal peptide synthetase [Streptomyces sp. TR06-5]|uniref:non-ribosomal peptide synthetase n=1 Tax=Streptomyces sp. TR06-5 TaxID=3385976 RepID=UPI0039A23B3E
MSEATLQSAGRRADLGPYKPVTALIEEQTDRTPHRPALTHRGEETETTLTYAEFDALANGLAAELTSCGVREGDMVPVVIGNSVELALCTVAVMKIGAVFTLCDPAWPEERLRAVFTVLRPPLALTSAPLASTGPRAHLVSWRDIAPSRERPGVRPGPDSPAYGVFTSGTTGVPKCAVNLHRGLSNRFRFMTRWFAATGDEVVLQNSRHTFDSAIWQMLWPLTTGGRTVIPEQGEFLDLERTVETIAHHRVTVTDFVPAILAMLVALLEADPSAVDKVSSLRHLVVGGEEIIPRAVHRLRELVPALTVTNGYGPSETSIGMVFHRVTEDDGDHIPLGSPIDNCWTVVADEDLRPLPPGTTGEILVGGECVGAGYLGDPARTAEVFVPNPFAEIPGRVLYRTGDLGRIGTDGLLRFGGRRDRQAKVDGVRIEPAEIETAGEGCPGVVQAKAMTLRRGGRTRLVLVAAADESLTPAALRDHLRGVLPRVQVPQHCFVLQALPLSDTGKVDLRALRDVVEEKLDSEADSAPPADASAAERIAHVMRTVLALPRFGTEDDFFAHGGDSLTALSVVIRIRDGAGLPVVLSDLYGHRTPELLAEALTAAPPPDAAGGDEALMARDAVFSEELAGLVAQAVRGGTPCADRPVPPRNVLVTGATGFVGTRTLHTLLTTTGARAVCVVRAPDDAAAARRVLRALEDHGLWDPTFAARIDARSGELGSPRFGLAAAEWDRLTAECDAVLHIGALVNFLLDYRAHRPANVLGTTEALRFALTGRPKPLHHVSTLGVLDRHAADHGRRLGEDCDPGTVTPPFSGYSRSKWVAERLLLEAARLGAPVTVYRLGEAMPAADNGLPNAKALTHLLLSAFHRLGVRPDVPMLSDWTPVDEAAARLVAGVCEPAAGAVYHVYRDRSVDFAGVEAAGGPGTRAVPPGEFMAALQALAETDRQSDAALLHAMLTSLPAAAPGCAFPDFRRLLADNPALFTRHACAALDARHALRDASLEPALAAYRTTLGAPVALSRS